MGLIFNQKSALAYALRVCGAVGAIGGLLGVIKENWLAVFVAASVLLGWILAEIKSHLDEAEGEKFRKEVGLRKLTESQSVALAEAAKESPSGVYGLLEVIIEVPSGDRDARSMAEDIARILNNSREDLGARILNAPPTAIIETENTIFVKDKSRAPNQVWMFRSMLQKAGIPCGDTKPRDDLTYDVLWRFFIASRSS